MNTAGGARLTSGETLFPLTIIGGCVLLVAAAATVGHAVLPAAGLLALVSFVAAAYRFALRWESLVGFLLVIVLFIPIKRYGFVVSLPFDLEPYRVTIAVLLGLWIAALLVDLRVTLRRSELDPPLMLFGLAVIASIAFNPQSITRLDIIRSFVGSQAVNLIRDATRIPYVDVSGTVAKALLFLISFYLAYYFIVGVIRTPEAIHSVLKVLVAGTAVVAAFSLLERRTGYNVFDHLQGVVPLVSFKGALSEEGIARAGRLRVYGPAQHPIALAALLVMVTPLSLYLAKHTKNVLWYACSGLLVLAALATVSRTSVTMLLAVGVVFYAFRRLTLRRVAVFVLPALVVIHLAVPGTIGGLRQAFFPTQGLLSDQTAYNGRASSSRLRPQFEVIEQEPAFGQGFGTRVTDGPDQNSRVLDNQWLGTAVETGLIGVFAWIWLFARFIRRAGAEARRDLSDRGWLLTAIAASILAFAVGMLTHDSFAFIQEFFIAFVILALGSSVLAWKGAWPEGAERECADGAARQLTVAEGARRARSR